MVDADLEAIGATPIGDGEKILRDRFGEWHRWETSVTQALHAAAGHGSEGHTI